MMLWAVAPPAAVARTSNGNTAVHLYSEDAAAVIFASVAALVTVRWADLGSKAARLVVKGGERTLLLNPASSASDLCRVLTETLCALTFGHSAAVTATTARPALRAVV